MITIMIMIMIMIIMTLSGVLPKGFYPPTNN